MFLHSMGRETVTIPVPHGIDWKGIGYLFSIVGALLLGAKAWPKPTDPWWHVPALVAGVSTTIIGFAVRYVAHLKQRREIAQPKREAERR
jgi:predicted phage tail protein